MIAIIIFRKKWLYDRQKKLQEPFSVLRGLQNVEVVEKREWQILHKFNSFSQNNNV